MLKRKLESEISKWKNDPNKMPLVVRGARQVGKTYLIEKFCSENYKYHYFIDFNERPGFKDVFSGNLDVKTLIKNLSLEIADFVIEKGETVIFLDEIQNCPNARTALKFMARSVDFDVIASGSLLGINYKEVESFPVGYTDQLEMHSLDFEEFCWANGLQEEGLGLVMDSFATRTPMSKSSHNRMLSLFREYIVVGGMPRVVQDFVLNHNFGNVLKMQRAILEDYKDDIAKYAKGNDKAKARSCFLSIPKQLVKDYKKFQYSVVEKGGTARKFGGSLMWLFDAGIINFCYNLTIPELPLEGNSKNNEFKVYMRDTGLLTAMLEDGSQANIIKGNLGIYKGAIYENIIADFFTKAGKKLYYFEKVNRLEVDFIIRDDNISIGIEVKSGDNTKAKSLNSLVEYWGVKKGIKLISGNVGVSGKIETLPLYMAMYL
ncbi:MAG: AAA family ATPase [Lachnospiraceae bacterium]|nr:AAA family ATPase [Lachnospiraceae bacterium]